MPDGALWAAAASAAAALLVTAASWRYLRDVRQRRADPRLASWGIFATAMGVGAAGAAEAGQWPSFVLTASGSLTCAAILVSGWRHGNREFGRLDAACALLGAAGVALLAVAAGWPRLAPAAAAVA
ncbi:MAG: hypothetical protein ACRDOL_40165, partial [Streptosporangiaceae bacterium]